MVTAENIEEVLSAVESCEFVGEETVEDTKVLHLKITEKGVTYEDIDSSCQSSMRELWEYLRSIPCRPDHFVANHYSHSPD